MIAHFTHYTVKHSVVIGDTSVFIVALTLKLFESIRKQMICSLLLCVVKDQMQRFFGC